MLKTLQPLFILFALLFTTLHTNATDVPPHGTLKGHVITSDNKAAVDVTVALQGTKRGTMTNDDGFFELTAPAGNYTLVISHVGVSTVTIPVEIRAGQTTSLPSITINTSATALQEVQVNGSKTNRFSIKKSNDVGKMPLTQLENPQSYSSITPALIQEQAVFTVDDAVKNAPGIQTMWNATGRSGDGGSYYSSRGFIVQSQLRNGVAGNVTSITDAANVAKIEVIKGPSGTLYGSSLTSFGGLINRVTKKPYETFGGQLSYTGGNYDYARTSLDVNTPLDAKKNVLFRLNTAYTSQDAYLNYGINKNFVFDPSLLIKINSRLTIQLDAEFSDGRNSIKPIYFFPYLQPVSAFGANRADQLNIDYNKTYFNDDLTQRSRNVNYFAQVNYQISNQWTSQTNFSSTNSFSNGFGPYFYLQGKDSISRNDQSTRDSKQNTIEVQENINGDFNIGGLRNRIVIGLDYFHLNSNQIFVERGFDVVPSISSTYNYNLFNKANLLAQSSYDYPYIYKTDTYSAYVSDVLNITDRLLALAAVRVDGYHNHGTYNEDGNQQTKPYNQAALSPKFGLVYQLVKNQLSLFGNYQNGFLNPGSYTGYDAATGEPVSRIAKVQNANQVEGGIKADLFDGKLNGTISYYDIKVTNVLRTDLTAPATAFAQVQDGTQLSRGIEAEIIANPFAGFNVVAGFSYNDSKYTKADADVLGRRPATASSPYSANFWVSYRLQAPAVNGLGFGFGGNYVSDNKVVNSATLGVFTLPSYTVLNASAFYDQPKYRFALNVNNLGNERYWTGYGTINPQNLRQYLATFTYKF